MSYVFSNKGSYLVPESIDYSHPGAVELVRRDGLIWLKAQKFTNPDLGSAICPLSISPVHLDADALMAPEGEGIIAAPDEAEDESVESSS